MVSIGRSHTVGDGKVVRLASPAMDRALELEQRLDAPWLEEADSTGHRLWPVCVALARYLCADPRLVRGKRVVELGAGTGAAGLVCAATSPSPTCRTLSASFKQTSTGTT